MRNQFYLLLQSIEGIVWEAELANFQFTFVSNYAKHILGYPPDQWLDKHFWENHIHPDDKTEVIRYYKQQAQAADGYTVEYRMIKADGDTA
ncbi:PAS domain-containing protein [Pedobacter steynii]